MPLALRIPTKADINPDGQLHLVLGDLSYISKPKHKDSGKLKRAFNKWKSFESEAKAPF